MPYVSLSDYETYWIGALVCVGIGIAYSVVALVVKAFRK